MSPNEASRLIKSSLLDVKDLVVKSESDTHISVMIPKAERCHWSPQLSLSFLSTERGCRVTGLYGINPGTWGVIFTLYSAFAFLFFWTAMWGITEWGLGMNASVLWVVPIWPILAFLLYRIDRHNRQLNSDQFYRLHYWFESVLEEQVIA